MMIDDLCNCYNFVANSHTFMVLRTPGAPGKALKYVVDCFQYMSHYICTAYGDSDQYYQSSPIYPW